MRFAVSLAVAALASTAPTEACAERYLALDANASYLNGPYRWNGPPRFELQGNSAPVRIDTRVYGVGSVAEFALGAGIGNQFSIAGEVGVAAFAVGSGFRWAGPSLLFAARLGVRCERRFGRAFARISGGYERAKFLGTSADDVAEPDNVWTSEPSGGPFGALAAGVRGEHAGFLGRIEAARITSEHAVFWPISAMLGVDVIWR